MYAFGAEPEAEPGTEGRKPAGPARSRGERRPGDRSSPGRTSTWRSSTSPPGLLVHPAPGNPGPTLVEELGDLLGGGADPAPPGDRPPARPRHLGAARRRPQPGGAHGAERDDRRPRGDPRSTSPSSRAARPRGRARSTRRSAATTAAPERVVVGGRRPRPAVTHFEVRERLPRDALLDVRLETGRTHQIRAHLQAIGNPVAGDPQYGSRAPLRARAPVPALAAARLRASARPAAARVREPAAGGPRGGARAGAAALSAPRGGTELRSRLAALTQAVARAIAGPARHRAGSPRRLDRPESHQDKGTQ